MIHRPCPRRTLRVAIAGLAAALAVVLLASTPANASAAAEAPPIVQDSDEAPSSGAVVPSEPTVGRDLTASYVVAALVVGVVIVLFIAQRRRTQPPD